MALNRLVLTQMSLMMQYIFISNNQLICPTPVPQIPGQFFLPQVNYPTPLVYAILCKQDLVVEKLLSLGANTELKVGQWEPIHFAVASRTYSITKILLSHKPSLVNRKVESTGNTPLHIAVSSGDNNLVLLLLKFSADPNVFNQTDKSPLFLAEHLHDMTIFKTLIIFEADYSKVNKNNISAKAYAEQNKLEMAITFFKEEVDKEMPSQEELLSTLDTLDRSQPHYIDYNEQINLLDQKISAAQEKYDFQNQK
ncbi:ankyrin repeat protein, putative [Trichomonas vaginalis G3]|uniref:Ankyrin repeat protein, putative n=1 Tax=Trichomonas vaginalis (strain ATCC PRA-98 / G3) TaxID=412133 RepID=A2F097_TRIV3|nr:ankyrin repeat protein, putative [Trichomonas vaginalis G3]|eukprot:XP_001314252.1 ankyrin repeat protein [Trichomonas vaginalis G3]